MNALIFMEDKMKLSHEKNLKFNETDKAIIESYKSAVLGIANLFGSPCEVLVHSLDNYENAVIAIENGHNSGRSIGAPITDLALELINKVTKNKEFLKPYESKLPNGHRCRSVTIPIKNGERLIGLLCINLNLDISFADFINSFMPMNKNSHNSENYSATIEDMMLSLLQKHYNDIMLDISIPNQDKNKEIILTLHKVGFFHLKGSIEALASKLQISVHTVYSNIRKYTEKNDNK